MTQAREEEVGSLVERLRGVRFAGQHYGVPGMCHEAADEIARMDSLITLLNRQAVESTNEIEACHREQQRHLVKLDELDTALEKIERLEGALHGLEEYLGGLENKPPKGKRKR